jgi:hypothetical protein
MFLLDTACKGDLPWIDAVRSADYERVMAQWGFRSLAVSILYNRNIIRPYRISHEIRWHQNSYFSLRITGFMNFVHSPIKNKKEFNVSETRSISVFRWSIRGAYSVGSSRKSLSLRLQLWEYKLPDIGLCQWDFFKKCENEVDFVHYILLYRLLPSFILKPPKA